MAEPRFSLCSLPIGVFLPSVVSQFSPVPLQHLLPLRPRRLSPFYLFLSLPLKTSRPPRPYVGTHISARATVYLEPSPQPSTTVSSSTPTALDPTCVGTAGERSDYESEGRFERDRYAELRRTGSHSMSNPDGVLCLLTRTSWRNREWSNASRALQFSAACIYFNLISFFIAPFTPSYNKSALTRAVSKKGFTRHQKLYFSSK